MNFSVQQSIVNAVNFAIAIAVLAIQPKHNNDMFFLRNLIERSLLLKDFHFETLFPNLDAIAKAFLSAKTFSKASIKR